MSATKRTLIAILLFPCAGCANRWSGGFTPAGMTARFAPGQGRVRPVEPERMNAFFQAERDRHTRRDIAAADQRAADLIAWKRRLLSALRIEDRPEDVLILGYSQFLADQVQDPYDGKLSQFASRIGSTYAVVCVSYGATFDALGMFPITTQQRSGDDNGNAAPNDARISWLAIRTKPDQFLHFVIFLRKLNEADRALLQKAYRDGYRG